MQKAPLSGIEVSITVLSQMFLYLASLFADKEDFLRSIGLDPEFIQSPDSYIPIETYLKIQDSAAEYTNDPYFGLHMGEYAEAGSWSILGYLMMNCKTLGQAFEKSGRYQRIIGNLIEGDGYIKFNKAKLVLYTPPHAPKMSRHCFESTLSSSVRMMRSLTGKDLNPLEVTFIYPEPEDTSEYERIFKCPVLFGQKETSITIPLHYLNIPILYHNPELLKHFESYAQKLIVEMDNPQEYTCAVTKIILSRLDDESLTIRKVAKEMAVSVRTLQNRLKEEGVVFSDLLTEIRERLAKKYLRENMTVEEITYLLGYSEPSSFRKAFKKWSGITPKEFRERSFSAPI
jgi:AraC-like DNA-binding protein